MTDQYRWWSSLCQEVVPEVKESQGLLIALVIPIFDFDSGSNDAEGPGLGGFVVNHLVDGVDANRKLARIPVLDGDSIVRLVHLDHPKLPVVICVVVAISVAVFNPVAFDVVGMVLDGDDCSNLDSVDQFGLLDDGDLSVEGVAGFGEGGDVHRYARRLVEELKKVKPLPAWP